MAILAEETIRNIGLIEMTGRIDVTIVIVTNEMNAAIEPIVMSEMIDTQKLTDIIGVVTQRIRKPATVISHRRLIVIDPHRHTKNINRKNPQSRQNPQKIDHHDRHHRRTTTIIITKRKRKKANANDHDRELDGNCDDGFIIYYSKSVCLYINQSICLWMDK